MIAAVGINHKLPLQRWPTQVESSMPVSLPVEFFDLNL